MKKLGDGIIEYKTERIDEYGMEELWDVKYNSGRDGFLKIQELAWYKVWIQRSGIKDKKYELYPVGNSFNLEQFSKQKISLTK